MSNAKLRTRLERMPAPVIAAMIDNGDVHNDGGILEFSYAAYCNPGAALRAGMDRVQEIKRVPVPPMQTHIKRERL